MGLRHDADFVITGEIYPNETKPEGPFGDPEEVHVTISTVRYESHGRNRHGVCSVLCAERVELGDKLPVYIQHNENFKLPEQVIFSEPLKREYAASLDSRLVYLLD